MKTKISIHNLMYTFKFLKYGITYDSPVKNPATKK
jgi:hypothetical protein